MQTDHFAFPLFICEVEEKLFAKNFDHQAEVRHRNLGGYMDEFFSDIRVTADEINKFLYQ